MVFHFVSFRKINGLMAKKWQLATDLWAEFGNGAVQDWTCNTRDFSTLTSIKLVTSSRESWNWCTLRSLSGCISLLLMVVGLISVFFMIWLDLCLGTWAGRCTLDLQTVWICLDLFGLFGWVGTCVCFGFFCWVRAFMVIHQIDFDSWVRYTKPGETCFLLAETVPDHFLSIPCNSRSFRVSQDCHPEELPLLLKYKAELSSICLVYVSSMRSLRLIDWFFKVYAGVGAPKDCESLVDHVSTQA